MSIREIDSNGAQKLVVNLTSPDEGPDSSNWNKKTISISTRKMNIEFKSDAFTEQKGFSANIYFPPIPEIECESWLDMNKNEFKSPNYPEPYHNTKKCSWLITVNHDYHITLNVNELFVRHQIIMTSKNSIFVNLYNVGFFLHNVGVIIGLFSLCRFFCFCKYVLI